MAASFSISVHAASRWIDRVDPGCDLNQARAAIRTHTKAIEAAIGMGCRCVRLGEGQRLIIDPVYREIITVLPTQPKMTGSKASGRACDFRAHYRTNREREDD